MLIERYPVEDVYARIPEWPPGPGPFSSPSIACIALAKTTEPGPSSRAPRCAQLASKTKTHRSQDCIRLLELFRTACSLQHSIKKRRREKGVPGAVRVGREEAGHDRTD